MKYRYAFILYLLAFIVQSSLLQNVSILGVAPNLLLLLTIALSFLFNERYGMIFGIIFGLISDLLFSQVIGVSALSYFLVALSVSSIKKYLYRDNIFSILFISAVGTIFYNALVWSISSIFGGDIGPLYALYKQPIAVVYNSLIMLPFYWFLVRKVIGYRGFKYM